MEPIVATTAGRVRGASAAGVLSFKGIPYAAAPFGPRRFAAPEPAPAWDGVRDRIDYGPTAVKPPYPRPIDELLPEPSIPGEDVLNLNVWTPQLDANLPVLVWIHGGAFVNGSGAVTVFDGTAFARDGIVCVTINYRLGVDGFLLLDGAPANRGLLDQIAALRWVQENIAAFGGDPDTVTIAGESAGAMSVTTLLSMPPADGLYQRAIAQSGAGHHVMSVPTAGKVTAALADALGVPPTVDGFAGIPLDTLARTQAQLSARIAQEPDPQMWGEIPRDGMAFEPCLDGTVLTARPIDRIAAGCTAGIDVLVGSNDDEYTLFLVPRGVHRFITDDVLRGFFAQFGADPESAVEAYRAAHRDATAGQLFMDALRDTAFRVPAIRVAEARPQDDTYVYEFAWRTPVLEGELGATHALEIGFVFDRLDDPNGKILTGPEPPQHLADEMHQAWVAFVRTGDPGWPSYGRGRAVMRFGAESEVVTDPAAALRTVWEGIR